MCLCVIREEVRQLRSSRFTAPRGCLMSSLIIVLIYIYFCIIYVNLRSKFFCSVHTTDIPCLAVLEEGFILCSCIYFPPIKGFFGEIFLIQFESLCHCCTDCEVHWGKLVIYQIRELFGWMNDDFCDLVSAVANEILISMRFPD